jgi:hypothetical protein
MSSNSQQMGNIKLMLLNSELAREKMWSRIHLIPLLTAEEDRDLVRRHYADQAREKELLGSQTSPYNSDRYVAVFVIGIRGWESLLLTFPDSYGPHSPSHRARNRNSSPNQIHIGE